MRGADYALAPDVHITPSVNRKNLLLVLTALIVPGGLIALFGAILFKQLQRYPKAKQVLAKIRVPALRPIFPVRQAA